MEFDKWILIVRELAWPLVALALAPFIIWRLGEIVRLHEAIKNGDFLREFLKLTEPVKAQLVELKALSEGLKADLDEQDIQKIFEFVDKRNEVEAIQAGKEFLPEPNTPPEVLYSRMQEAWGDLNKIVAAKLKLKGIGKDFDARSLRIAVIPLSLDQSDAEFISNLQSQYSRLRRLKATKEEWLTPDVYSNFMARVAKAKNLINQPA